MSTVNEKNTPEQDTFAYFLESVPPGTKVSFSDLFVKVPGDHWILKTPDLQLHCPSHKCGEVRFFELRDTLEPFPNWKEKDVFLTYTCRNCKEGSKTYALGVCRKIFGYGSAEKYGEMPAFGPPLPPRLLKMVGDDRDLLLKGRSAENQGLGIGAFVYYRRVVENQKDRLLAEIRDAAVRLNADEELLSSIDLAIKETRFSEALKLVKDAIPDGLKVKGQNPLRLLHRALSKGVHVLDDTECLERAQAVRRVLTKLVSNIAQITKEERELDEAVNKLQSIK